MEKRLRNARSNPSISKVSAEDEDLGAERDSIFENRPQLERHISDSDEERNQG